jgi:hypothetical protein
MVMANRALLRQVRRLAIRDEFRAKQPRGRLLALDSTQPEGGPVGEQAGTQGRQPAGRLPRRLDGKG